MRPGRPRKLTFPIRRTEVWHGRDVVRTIEENTTVNCVRCSAMFLINYDTAYLARDKYDSEVPEVRCPQCNRRASIYHYYDRIVRGRRRRQSKD